jgi:LacI family transcriptional regulator
LTRTTIKDVSDAAGVSIKTVSRVLNKEKYVSEDTRLRVEAAVARLNYHPSLAARTLAGRRSFQIGLIHDNPNPYYIYNMQAGVGARCREAGFRMIVQPCDIHSPALIDDIGSLIDQAQLDGIILTPPVADAAPALEELERRRIPFVRVQPGTDLTATSSSFIDNVQAADDMTAYLIGLGHRRIGLVMGHANYVASGQRLTGYRQALQRAGIGFDPVLVQAGQFDLQSGSAAAEALLALDRPPTAIFASSDEMAAGVLATAHRLGIAVPGMLSVAGFDDTDLAQVVWPPLTTIRQPIRALGYAAADLLLAFDERIERRRLDHELIVRASTAPPGGG